MATFRGQHYLDFDEPAPVPAARRTDPVTSHEAADAARSFATNHRQRILDALADGPASKTQLAGRTGIDGVAVARRTAELLIAGEIVVVSHDGISATGKRERVYGLAPHLQGNAR